SSPTTSSSRWGRRSPSRGSCPRWSGSGSRTRSSRRSASTSSSALPASGRWSSSSACRARSPRCATGCSGGSARRRRRESARAPQDEFVALRACGVSVWQITPPLLVLAALISAGAFAWNETVVPYSAHRWHEIENLEIKGRGPASVFAGREVWFHGRAGFYNIDRVSPRKQTLWGLAVYQLDADFRLARLIEAESAVWDGALWQLVGARTLEFA